MRQILLSLILLSFINSYGQEIELQGRYGAFFLGGETINFIGKDSFYFNGSYCTNEVYGKGKCEIVKGHLYLYFEKTKNKPCGDSLKAPIIIKNNSDTISTIQVTCVDIKSRPLYFVSVHAEINEKNILSTFTDSIGNATMKLKKDSYPLTLKVSAIGYDPTQVILKSDFDYDIKIFLAENKSFHKELNDGEVFIYEIEDITDEELLMRPQGSKESFRRYRKIDR